MNFIYRNPYQEILITLDELSLSAYLAYVDFIGCEIFLRHTGICSSSTQVSLFLCSGEFLGLHHLGTWTPMPYVCWCYAGLRHPGHCHPDQTELLSGFRTVWTPSVTGCSAVISNWKPAKLRWCGAPPVDVHLNSLPNRSKWKFSS